MVINPSGGKLWASAMGNSAETWEWFWHQITYCLYQIQKLPTCWISWLIDSACWFRYQNLWGQGEKSVFIGSTKDSKQYTTKSKTEGGNSGMKHSQCPTWPVELQCLKSQGFGVPPTWLRFQIKRYRCPIQKQRCCRFWLNHARADAQMESLPISCHLACQYGLIL